MRSYKEQIPSPDVLVGWARFLGVSLDKVKPERIEPQIKRLMYEIKRFEEINLTDVEPSTIFPATREL